jgi:hypothetical protein
VLGAARVAPLVQSAFALGDAANVRGLVQAARAA